MQLDDLRIFAAVVEHGGFRSAAAALYTSQPSLSRRIKRLEEDLGVMLLERGPWGLRPTPHGAALLKGSHRLFAAADELRATAIGAWDETLRLGAAQTAAGSYLTEFIAHWIHLNPGKKLRIVDDGAVRLQSRLAQAECDLAILLEPIPPDFDSLPIRRAQVTAIIPTDHRLAQVVGPLPVTDLAGERLLVEGRASASTEVALSSCRAAGIGFEVIYECNIWWMLAAFAERGLGISIVGDNLDTRGMDLIMRPLHHLDGQPLTFDLCVAWLRHRQLSPVAEAFANELSDFTRDLRYHSTHHDNK